METTNQQFIYHIADTTQWGLANASGEYIHPSLAKEGFIHCSTRTQVEATANLYFANESDLLLLCIDISKLIPPLKYELASRGEEFPHIYGRINVDSVIETKTIQRHGTDKFRVIL